MLTAISLFSGIGGIDLALVSAGFTVIAQVEIDSFCREVLRKNDRYWEHSIMFADIRHFNTDKFPGGYGCDIIAGGFPCQPFSNAGLMLGRDDNRELSHEFLRTISVFRPRSVFMENVPAIVNVAGLDIIKSLATMGYDCWWGVVPASDIGAPHLRERWFCAGTLGDTDSKRLQTVGKVGLGQNGISGELSSPVQRTATRTTRSVHVFGDATNWKSTKTAYRFSGENDGLPSWLHKHQFPPHPDEMDFSQMEIFGNEEGTTKQIKALGNAVVPQVVYPIVKAIFNRLSNA